MTSDHRITPSLIRHILGALERHDYFRSDNLRAGRATGLIGGPARLSEGTQGHPAVACPRTVPPWPAAYPGPGRHGAVTLTRDDASTVFAAPDIAADDKRHCAEMCPGCPGRSCQIHLPAARASDQMAVRTLPAAQAVPATSASQPAPDRWYQPATGSETGK